MRKIKCILSMLVLVLTLSFIKIDNVYASDNLVRGADIGWLSQLEDQGVSWVDDNGNEADVLDILQEKGINAVRIRAFVNPPSNFQWTKPSGYDVMLGYADTQGVLYTAQRAKDKGMKIMLVFHYSDHFADPQYQDIPAQWSNASAEQLEQYVYDYTYYLMNQLKVRGIYPEWVEVGNEINSGILHTGDFRFHGFRGKGVLKLLDIRIGKIGPMSRFSTS